MVASALRTANSFLQSESARQRIIPCSKSQRALRGSLRCQLVTCGVSLSSKITLPMPHVQSPLELGAAGLPPPSTADIKISDQVRICNWQDPQQQGAAASELQAFCAASIQNLGLQSFTPLLLRGAVSGWRAVDKWSLDYLVDQYGEQRFVQHPP